MTYKIIPKKLNLNITVPSSKSYTHRALIASFLCHTPCKVNSIYYSEDIKATENALKAIKKNSVIDCKESGSSLRFLIPLATLFSKKNIFVFGDSLDRRPLGEYYRIFDEQNIKYIKKPNKLTVNGSLKPGIFRLNGSISSQFLTGLLLTLPILEKDSEIFAENIQSESYIEITLDVLKSFGINIINENYTHFHIRGNQKYSSEEYTPEGDWSSGAFWYFMKEKHNININGLNENSCQGDRAVTEIIRNFPKVFSAENCPDLVPCLVAYSLWKGEEILIKDCKRLKYKECDRLKGLNEYRKLGADILTGEDYIKIGRNHRLKKGFLRSFGDHRMVMSYILFSYLTGTETETDDINCLSKSYPDLIKLISEK